MGKEKLKKKERLKTKNGNENSDAVDNVRHADHQEVRVKIEDPNSEQVTGHDHQDTFEGETVNTSGDAGIRTIRAAIENPDKLVDKVTWTYCKVESYSQSGLRSSSNIVLNRNPFNINNIQRSMHSPIKVISCYVNSEAFGSNFGLGNAMQHNSTGVKNFSTLNFPHGYSVNTGAILPAGLMFCNGLYGPENYEGYAIYYECDPTWQYVDLYGPARMYRKDFRQFNNNGSHDMGVYRYFIPNAGLYRLPGLIEWRQHSSGECYGVVRVIDAAQSQFDMPIICQCFVLAEGWTGSIADVYKYHNHSISWDREPVTNTIKKPTFWRKPQDGPLKSPPQRPKKCYERQIPYAKAHQKAVMRFHTKIYPHARIVRCHAEGDYPLNLRVVNDFDKAGFFLKTPSREYKRWPIWHYREFFSHEIALVKKKKHQEKGHAYLHLAEISLTMISDGGLGKLLLSEPFNNLEHVIYRTDNSICPRNQLGIMSQLLRALQHIHKMKFMHGDIMPVTVKILLSGKVQLFHPLRVVKTKYPSRSKTFSERVYLAPEVLFGRRATPAADMFALGCVFAEMLIRKRIFYKTFSQEDYLSQIHEVCSSPNRFFKDKAIMPNGLDLLTRLLQPRPEDRPTAEEALKIGGKQLLRSHVHFFKENSMNWIIHDSQSDDKELQSNCGDSTDDEAEDDSDDSDRSDGYDGSDESEEDDYLDDSEEEDYPDYRDRIIDPEIDDNLDNASNHSHPASVNEPQDAEGDADTDDQSLFADFTYDESSHCEEPNSDQYSVTDSPLRADSDQEEEDDRYFSETSPIYESDRDTDTESSTSNKTP